MSLVLSDWRTLGDGLRKARLERGLTQLELARQLNFRSPQRVNAIETKAIELSTNEVVAYLRALVELEKNRCFKSPTNAGEQGRRPKL